MTERLCLWCRRGLPATLGKRARFHGRKCRQAFWRVRRASLLQASDGTKKRANYADPPYPGTARKYYRNEATYAGEVDHAALVAELRTFDGWALSTSAKALREVWNLCPEARLAVWVKPQSPRNKRAHGAHNVFECVLFVPARSRGLLVPDALITSPARGDDSNLPGRKPRRFCQWLFQLLALQPGDDLIDRFPGSGIVGRVWLASSGAGSDAAASSGYPNDGASPGDESDEGVRQIPGAPSYGTGGGGEASSAAASDAGAFWQPPDFGLPVASFRTSFSPRFDCYELRGWEVWRAQPSPVPGGDGASPEYSSDGASSGAPSDDRLPAHVTGCCPCSKCWRLRAAAIQLEHPAPRCCFAKCPEHVCAVELSPRAADDALSRPVLCQLCGEQVSAATWLRHRAEHASGARPKLPAIEAFLRAPAPETSLAPADDATGGRCDE